jgi:hypothetical protein
MWRSGRQTWQPFYLPPQFSILTESRSRTCHLFYAMTQGKEKLGADNVVTTGLKSEDTSLVLPALHLDQTAVQNVPSFSSWGPSSVISSPLKHVVIKSCVSALTLFRRCSIPICQTRPRDFRVESFLTIVPCLQAQVLVIGLGGGALPMFLHNHLPLKVKVLLFRPTFSNCICLLE